MSSHVPEVDANYVVHLFSLAGKVALVTGGASGLGEAISLGFTQAAATSEAIFADLEKRLQQHVGTRVRIVGKASSGKIEIEYFSPEDLDRILQLLRLPSG
jgi:NAD(P)-dependent dehydrogenase (short-subunit alcohol dehydrogenase family)